MNINSSKLYSVVLPIVISMLGTAILVAYLSPWNVGMTDATTYLRMAEEIQKGHWHIDNWIRGSFVGPPLYPLLVAISEWFFLDFERAGTIVSIAAACLLVVPLFFFTRYIYSGRVAWLIIPLTILNPFYLAFVSLPLTESLFTLIFLSCLCLTYCALKSKIPLLWCAVGILSGAAWMTRDVGIIIPFISMFWVIMDRWINKLSVSNIVKNTALLTLGIIIVVVPLKLMMYLDLKNVPNLPVNSITRQLMMPELKDGMEREAYLGGLNKDSTEYLFVEAQKNPPNLGDILQNVDLILKRFVNNCIEVAISIHTILGTVFIIFVFGGILAAIFYWEKEFNVFIGQLLFPGVYFIFYILFYSIAGAFTGAIGPERYLVPLIPVLGVWAVGGISKISNLADKTKIRHVGIVASYLCLVFILVTYKSGLIQVKQSLGGYNGYNPTLQLAKGLGTGLKNQVSKPGGDNITIMSRKPLVPYYAGADWVVMPYGGYQEIVKFAKNRNVDLLYLDKETVLLRPQLSFLLNRHVNIPEMQKFYWMSSKENPEEIYLVLYQINDSLIVRNQGKIHQNK